MEEHQHLHEKKTPRLVGEELTVDPPGNYPKRFQDASTSYLFLRNFLGKITQRTNSPTKAPAAMIAIIPSVPPNRL